MKKINNAWFTLVEIIVAVAILSVIMVSVFAAFAIASDVNNRTEVSRAIQNNIKTALEIISEDVRLQDIDFSKHNILLGRNHNESKILYTKEVDENWDTIASSEYRLWTKDLNWNWVYNEDCYWNIDRVNDSSERKYFACSLIKNDGLDALPITNSWVDFTDLMFYVSNKTTTSAWRPKVMINFDMRPSFRKWIKSKIIEKNKIKLQTTLNSKYIEHDE